MNHRVVQVVGLVVVGMGSAIAAAEPVTSQQAHLCDKEWATADATPAREKWMVEAMKSGQGISAPCKAEITRRKELCLKDPGLDLYLRERGFKSEDADRICTTRPFFDLQQVVSDEEDKKKTAEADAKAAAEQKAKDAADVAAAELPKAQMRDPKLEKMVADAFKRDYPSSKLIKVILGTWSSDYEKDAFNRVTGRDLDATVVNKGEDGKCYLHGELGMQHGNGRSFSGALSARGAGSASDKEILCEKAEAVASSAPAGKSKSKKK